MVESNLSDLPSDEIRSALCETVEHQLKSNKYNIQVSSASKAGEHNFIGEVYRVSFSKDDEAENEKKETNKLILKIAPQNPSRRQMFKSRDLFLREIFMYDEVLPYFRKFEESKGVIVEENGFIEYPNCYRTVDIDPSECVILEDLSGRDFAMIDRYTEEVSAEHVRLVMKSLGKYHAISFALKDQQPEKFKEFASNLKELFIRRDEEQMKVYFKKMIEDVLMVLPGDEDAGLRSKIQDIIDKHPTDVSYECVNAMNAEPATIITHGDVWQNNTMFRYDDNKNPVEICLIDWQVSRHSSPVIDLVYYMFCCTTKELRDVHYDEFLKVYHESLSTSIRNLGSDPEKLFPYKLLLEHLQKFGKFGLIMSAMLLPMITNESGNGLDLDELSVQMENGVEFDENVRINENTRHKFNKRMRDVIVDMEKLKYI